MNYYNPYFYSSPSMMRSASPGIIRGLLGGSRINWSSLLSGTQKVVNIANQAIPAIKQMAPVMRNAKTMFRVMNEFKKVDTPITKCISENTTCSDSEETQTPKTQEQKLSYTGPTFFI